MPTRAKIVTRTETTSSNSTENLNKGSKLTFAEMDSNFIELQNQSIGVVGDDSTGIDVGAGDTIKIAGGTGITTAVSGDTITINGANQAQGITFVGDDSTGTLIADGETVKIAGTGGITTAMTGDTLTIDGSGITGSGANLGNLQVNDTTLSPVTTNDNLVLTANGTGDVLIQTDSNSLFYVGPDTVDNHFEFAPGSGILRWRTGGTTSAIFDHSTGGAIEIESINTDNIRITPAAIGGQVIVGPTGGIAYVSSSGANDLKLWTNSGTSSGTITIVDGVDGDIEIVPNGTGRIKLDNNYWPNTDGTSGQVLSTNGAGTTSWIDSAVDLGNLQVNDTTISPITTNDNLILQANGSGAIRIGDIDIDNFGNYAYQTFIAPTDVGGGTSRDLIIRGRENGVVGVPGSLVAFSGQSVGTYDRTTFTKGIITHVGANESAAEWELSLRAGSDFTQPYTAINLSARSVTLNHNTNSDIIATGGNGDLRIQNGGDIANLSGSTAFTVGHNFITLTDNNDGEIIISPKTDKWIQADGIKIQDNTISSNESNANLELDSNGSGNVVISGLTYPNTDGTAGQVLSTDGSGTLDWVSVSGITPITFVGDDSTGTAVAPGETFKIAGATGISTAVAGDTLTITGPDLSSYITNSPITVVGDDSTGTTLNTGETLKVTGTGGLTAVVTGDTLTIDGSGVAGGGGSATGLTFVGDDSTGTLISDGETIKIAGGSGITTAMSGDTLTITASGSANTGDYIFTGNTMSTGSSNADMELTTSGTGKILLKPLGGDYNNYKSRYDNPSYYTGNILYYENLADTAGTREYGNTLITNIKTDGADSSASNARYRNYFGTSLDLNGANLTSSSTYVSRGVQNTFESIVYNTAAGGDDASVANHAGIMVNPSAGIQSGTPTSALTVTSMAGVSTTNDFIAGTDAGGTVTVPNSYNFYSSGWGIDSNTKSNIDVQNHYGVYLRDAFNTSDSDRNPTNVYSFVTAYDKARAKPGALEKFNEYAYEATHSSGAGYTLDFNNGNLQAVTLTSNITSFTMSNFPTDSKHSVGVTLYLIQDGTGSRTMTFGAGSGETFKFSNGANSSSVSAANDIQVCYIFSRYDGTSNTFYWTIGPAFS